MSRAPEALSLIADVALRHAERVLLVRYVDTNAYDHQRGWFLPDDALHPFEHPDAAAHRILREQLGVDDPKPELGFIESFRGNDRSWHLVFHYVAHVEVEPDLFPSPNLAEATWFPLDALPPRDEVAHHGWALSILRRLESRQPSIVG